MTVQSQLPAKVLIVPLGEKSRGGGPEQLRPPGRAVGLTPELNGVGGARTGVGVARQLPVFTGLLQEEKSRKTGSLSVLTRSLVRANMKEMKNCKSTPAPCR